MSTVDIVVGSRGTRLRLGLALLLIGLVAAMPWWADRAWVRTATELLYLLALAQLWNLLAGYCGLLSVGQQAFVGLGAYTLVVLGLEAGWTAYWVIPVAGAVGAVGAALVSPVVFKLKGAYFAVGTWVVSEVIRIVIANLPFASGGAGVSVARTVSGVSSTWRDPLALWSALVLGVGVTAAIYALLRSRWGLALMAVRDSERAAGSLGIDGGRVRRWVWVAAGAGCAMVGALIFATKFRVSPAAAFSLDWSTTAFFIVVIGGIGTLEGPLVGVLIYFFLREWLSDLGGLYLIIVGSLTMLVMLFAKDGVWGWIAHRTDWHAFPVQRRVREDGGGATPGPGA